MGGRDLGVAKRRGGGVSSQPARSRPASVTVAREGQPAAGDARSSERPTARGRERNAPASAPCLCPACATCRACPCCVCEKGEGGHRSTRGGQPFGSRVTQGTAALAPGLVGRTAVPEGACRRTRRSLDRRRRTCRRAGHRCTERSLRRGGGPLRRKHQLAGQENSARGCLADRMLAS